MAYLPYSCPVCRKDRQTSANAPPVQCPTCDLDERDRKTPPPAQRIRHRAHKISNDDDTDTD